MEPCKPVIAVFSYGGIEGPTLDSYVNEVLFAQRHKIPLMQTRVHGDALISRSRSKALSGFLALPAADANVFFMLDHDLEWSEGDVLATCAKAHERQAIVGGIYSCRGFAMGHSGRFMKEGVRYKPGTDELHEAEYIGGGFVAIPRLVAEEVLKRGQLSAMGAEEKASTISNIALHECIYTDKASFYDFFRPITIPGTLNPKDTRHEYLSEDWAFPVAPDTRVLGADWRWRKISDIYPGGSVMAVDENSPPHSSRRIHPTQVTGQVARSLPLWRIVTSEREFITSAEHPWLHKRMWRRPVGQPRKGEALGLRAPAKWGWTPTEQLRPGDQLARVVPPEVNPDVTNLDYLAGYVQGLFQSDGTGSAEARFTIRMCDAEPLERLSTFLATLGVRNTRMPLKVYASENHRPQHGVAVYQCDAAERLEPLVRRTDLPSRPFAAGFLAGMYDGDGSRDGGTLSIHNLKTWKKERVIEAGKQLGLSFAMNPRNVRLVGAEERYRFWQLTSPALSRRLLPIGQMGNDRVVRFCEAKHTPEVIEAVEPLQRKGDLLCLVTETSTFIAEGVASHNCWRARQANPNRPQYLWAKPVLRHWGSHGYMMDTAAKKGGA